MVGAWLTMGVGIECLRQSAFEEKGRGEDRRARQSQHRTPLTEEMVAVVKPAIQSTGRRWPDGVNRGIASKHHIAVNILHSPPRP